MANYNVTDKNSRGYQENLYKGSRNNLLVVLIFTSINLISLVTGGNSYWLFSASVPYYMTAFGMGFDAGVQGSAEPMVGTFTITALVISVVILVAYLLCWIFAKKHHGWLIAAMVMFALDTLAMLALIVLLQINIADIILDIVFHGWVLFSLVRGVIAFNKLKNMPEDVVEVPAAPQYTGPELD